MQQSDFFEFQIQSFFRGVTPVVKRFVLSFCWWLFVQCLQTVFPFFRDPNRKKGDESKEESVIDSDGPDVGSFTQPLESPFLTVLQESQKKLKQDPVSDARVSSLVCSWSGFALLCFFPHGALHIVCLRSCHPSFAAARQHAFPSEVLGENFAFDRSAHAKFCMKHVCCGKTWDETECVLALVSNCCITCFGSATNKIESFLTSTCFEFRSFVC